MKVWAKRSLWVLGIFVLLLVSYFAFCATLIGVNPKTKDYFNQLKMELEEQGYRPALFVMSTKRLKLQNELIRPFGAAKYSQHLKGNALDVLVLDVNGDGKANSNDVDIVYAILDKKIVRNNRGVGSYKTTWGFFSQQMVHLDCRGFRARWNR